MEVTNQYYTHVTVFQKWRETALLFGRSERFVVKDDAEFDGRTQRREKRMDGFADGRLICCQTRHIDLRIYNVPRSLYTSKSSQDVSIIQLLESKFVQSISAMLHVRFSQLRERLTNDNDKTVYVSIIHRANIDKITSIPFNSKKNLQKESAHTLANWTESVLFRLRFLAATAPSLLADPQT